MADRDDAMDVGAIEDDALNDDDEENSDEVEEGYKMAKVSGYLHFSNEHRPEVTTRVNAMEGLAPRERSQKIIAELGKHDSPLRVGLTLNTLHSAELLRSAMSPS